MDRESWRQGDYRSNTQTTGGNTNVNYLGLKMSYALNMMLSFCDDQVERRHRQAMVVNLCEEMVSWVPQSYFEQRNLSDTGYAIYFVALFGRGAINHSLHKTGLHRKRFIRSMPESVLSETTRDPIYAKWSTTKLSEGKTSPVQSCARHHLVEILDRWMAESTTEFSMTLHKELDLMQRYLFAVDKQCWGPNIIGGSIIGGGNISGVSQSQMRYPNEIDQQQQFNRQPQQQQQQFIPQQQQQQTQQQFSDQPPSSSFRRPLSYDPYQQQQQQPQQQISSPSYGSRSFRSNDDPYFYRGDTLQDARRFQ